MHMSNEVTAVKSVVMGEYLGVGTSFKLYYQSGKRLFPYAIRTLVHKCASPDYKEDHQYPPERPPNTLAKSVNTLKNSNHH